jgi:hypothetical protein
VKHVLNNQQFWFKWGKNTRIKKICDKKKLILEINNEKLYSYDDKQRRLS